MQSSRISPPDQGRQDVLENSLDDIRRHDADAEAVDAAGLDLEIELRRRMDVVPHSPRIVTRPSESMKAAPGTSSVRPWARPRGIASGNAARKRPRRPRMPSPCSTTCSRSDFGCMGSLPGALGRQKTGARHSGQPTTTQTIASLVRPSARLRPTSRQPGRAPTGWAAGRRAPRLVGVGQVARAHSSSARWNVSLG